MILQLSRKLSLSIPRSLAANSYRTFACCPHVQDQFVAPTRRGLYEKWHQVARESTKKLDKAPTDDALRNELHSAFTTIMKDGSMFKNQKYEKRELISEFGLQPRDLRSLDAHLLDVRPILLVAQHSILICTPIMRALVKPDKMLVIEPDPRGPLVSDEEHESIVDSIQTTLERVEKIYSHIVFVDGQPTVVSTQPFELRALEAVLLLTVKGLRIITENLQTELSANILESFKTNVNAESLHNLLNFKRIVDEAYTSGREMQSQVARLLGDDEDLANMYLTDKLNKKPHQLNNHQEVELLLEYYERRLDESNETSHRLATILEDIDSNIGLTIQSVRLRLQKLELQTAITALAVGSGTAIAGVFGMNLASGLEQDPYAFRYAVYGGCVSMAVFIIIGFGRMIFVQRAQLSYNLVLRKHKK